MHKQKRKKEKSKKTIDKKPKHYRGIYKNISYESSLELASVLHCESLGLQIKNCDVGPIEYFNPQTQDNRKYYPDFIVNGFLIIEVKWLGFVWKKNKAEIRSKRKALEKFCEDSGKYATLFVTNNTIKKKFVNLAKQIHEEKYGKIDESPTSGRRTLGESSKTRASRRNRRS